MHMYICLFELAGFTYIDSSYCMVAGVGYHRKRVQVSVGVHVRTYV